MSNRTAEQALQYTYQVGETIEARDPVSGAWRRGIVAALRPYRGKPGYDVSWTAPVCSEKERKANDLQMPSSGGWQYEAVMRKIEQ